MNFLKDIPDIGKCSDFEYLSQSELWEIPLRFINEDAIEAFQEQAKKELSSTRADDLANHIVLNITLSRFVGVLAHSQIKKLP